MEKLEKMKELIFQNLYDLTLLDREYRERILNACSYDLEADFSSLVSLGQDLTTVKSQVDLLTNLINESEFLSDYITWLLTDREEDNNDEDNNDNV